MASGCSGSEYKCCQFIQRNGFINGDRVADVKIVPLKSTFSHRATI